MVTPIASETAAALVVLWFGICCAIAQPISNVDGQADFFPCGAWFYWQPDVPDAAEAASAYLDGIFDTVSSLGMNTVVADAVPPDRYNVVLDAAHRRGLKVILPGGKAATFIRGGWDEQKHGALADAIEAHIAAVGAHPALLMHYVYDVPRTNMIPRLAQVNELFRRLSPEQPTFVAYMHDVAAIANGANSPTVSWDNFPIATTNPPGVFVNLRYDIGSPYEEHLFRIRRETPGRRHILLIQAFDSPNRLRFPTPAEMRCQVHLAFLNGWTDGLLFYRLHTRGKGDKLSQGLLDTTGQVRAGYPEALQRICTQAVTFGRLLTGTTPGDLPNTPPAPLRWQMFSSRTHSYLLLVNRDVEHPVARRVSLPNEWAPETPIQQVLADGELRPANRIGDGLDLELPPGDAALFRSPLEARHVGR